MANTAFSPTNSVTTTSAANFIPEIWSDEIVAAYKKNLVLANLVKKMSFKGKKGDTVNIPSPARGSASAKAATDAVTLIAESDTNIQVLINSHYEYSRLIEDIVEVQALTSLRSFYTEDAGYALARRIDTDLVQLGRAFNGATVGTDDYATASVGAPLEPTLRIFSLEPALIRSCLALMLAYKPCFISSSLLGLEQWQWLVLAS